MRTPKAQAAWNAKKRKERRELAALRKEAVSYFSTTHAAMRMRIRKLRLDAGLTYEQAAKLICVTKQQQQIMEEKEKGGINTRTLLSICKAYDVTPNYLLGFIDNPKD